MTFSCQMLFIQDISFIFYQICTNIGTGCCWLCQERSMSVPW